MPEQSWVDKLYKSVGDAITDIREKVVEEPMWGRNFSDRESASPQWPQARDAQEQSQEQTMPEHDRDAGIDR